MWYIGKFKKNFNHLVWEYLTYLLYMSNVLTPFMLNFICTRLLSFFYKNTTAVLYYDGLYKHTENG